ncbi:MAG: hypothetical protein ACE5IR_26410 [bacterium]
MATIGLAGKAFLMTAKIKEIRTWQINAGGVGINTFFRAFESTANPGTSGITVQFAFDRAAVSLDITTRRQIHDMKFSHEIGLQIAKQFAVVNIHTYVEIIAVLYDTCRFASTIKYPALFNTELNWAGISRAVRFDYGFLYIRLVTHGYDTFFSSHGNSPLLMVHIFSFRMKAYYLLDKIPTPLRFCSPPFEINELTTTVILIDKNEIHFLSDTE